MEAMQVVDPGDESFCGALWSATVGQPLVRRAAIVRAQTAVPPCEGGLASAEGAAAIGPEGIDEAMVFAGTSPCQGGRCTCTGVNERSAQHGHDNLKITNSWEPNSDGSCVSVNSRGPSADATELHQTELSLLLSS